MLGTKQETSNRKEDDFQSTGIENKSFVGFFVHCYILLI